MAGRETGNEDVEVGRHGVVLKLVFVINLDPLFCEHGHVPNIIFIAVMEFVKFDGVVKFFDLGLVRLLTKFAPHGI